MECVSKSRILMRKFVTVKVTNVIREVWMLPPNLQKLLHLTKKCATVATLKMIVLPMEMEMGILFCVRQNFLRDVLRNKKVISL